MASADPFDSEPGTFDQAVLFDRLRCVLRAGRRISARWGHPPGAFLIKADEARSQRDADSVHAFIPSKTSNKNFSILSPRSDSAPGFKTITISSLSSGSAPSFPSASLHLRRIAFRLAIEPSDFAATTAALPSPLL